MGALVGHWMGRDRWVEIYAESANVGLYPTERGVGVLASMGF